MSTQSKPTGNRKAYQEPEWEKREIFERFIAACKGKNAKAVSPCTKLLT